MFDASAVSMSGAELESMAGRGGGSAPTVKAALAPLVAEVKRLTGSDSVFVRNGRVVVEFEPAYQRDDVKAGRFISSARCWKAIWVAARATVNGLGAGFRVKKPTRWEKDGGTFRLIRDSFAVEVK